MPSATKTIKLTIGGMTCVHCQHRVKKGLCNVVGVQSASASYDAGTATVTYDPAITSRDALAGTIGKLGYSVTDGPAQKQGAGRIAGFLLAVIALYAVLEWTGFLNRFAPSRLANAEMEYGILFITGLITSVHCVSMCGGITLSQCIPNTASTKNSGFASFRPALLYNLGRVISYTMGGFIAGAFGSAVVFTTSLQGALKLIAGIFMIIMGLTMTGLFPWLRKLSPRLPAIFTRKTDSKSPFIVGLLNGLMPCGPLQAMQIYALSTGNPVAGAFSMFLFGLGTVPLVFSLGALSTALGRKFTSKAMAVGAVLVIVLGLGILSQGWSLAGLPSLRVGHIVSRSNVRIADGVQLVESVLAPGEYPDITVKAGIPVKWIINAPKGSINGCNNRFFIRDYGIEHSFQPGANSIDFTPDKAGIIRYSCWMGMIHGTITVTRE